MLTPRIIPKPLRDVLLGFYFIRNPKDPNVLSMNCSPAENMFKASFRIVITALALFAFKKNTAAVVVATSLSLPCTLIAGGGWLFYQGIAITVRALVSKSFLSLGIGVTSLVAGYGVLEFHDWTFPKWKTSVGLLEKFVIVTIATDYRGEVEKIASFWE